MREPIESYFDRHLRLPDPDAADPGERAAKARGRLHLAACALLLELAHADAEFSDLEQGHIEAVLRRHFGLDEATARELMEVAESERLAAGDVQPFAAFVRSSYDRGQRALLAEIMWGLVLADGRIARHEAYLLRRIASLLDLEPGYLSVARGAPDGGG
jgi:uncharacterized tellurite resistance protein B-like protein